MVERFRKIVWNKQDSNQIKMEILNKEFSKEQILEYSLDLINDSEVRELKKQINILNLKLSSIKEFVKDI